MPRKLLIRSNEYPYHVTARANNRESFPLSLEYIWSTCINELAEIEEQSKVRIHSFVLMPNHFHLVISTPVDDLGIAMQQFMRSVTKTINWKAERSGRIFGAKYHWSLIDSTDYFDCVMKYVYRNPVKASLATDVRDYRFSTLSNAIEPAKVKISLHPPIGETSVIPNQDIAEYLRWLNEPFRSEQDIEIRNALKRSIFKPVRLRRKRSELTQIFPKFNAS